MDRLDMVPLSITCESLLSFGIFLTLIFQAKNSENYWHYWVTVTYMCVHIQTFTGITALILTFSKINLFWKKQNAWPLESLIEYWIALFSRRGKHTIICCQEGLLLFSFPIVFMQKHAHGAKVHLISMGMWVWAFRIS